MQKIREPMVIRSTFVFSHWNRDNKTDDPVLQVPWLSIQKQKCHLTHSAPTILNLPHPTLLYICLKEDINGFFTDLREEKIQLSKNSKVFIFVFISS